MLLDAQVRGRRSLRDRALDRFRVGVEPTGTVRQDVEVQPNWSFERVCPTHMEILGGRDGFWCPKGRFGHTVRPANLRSLDDAGEAWASVLVWVVVAIPADGGEIREAAQVFGSGRVVTSEWFDKHCPEASAALAGRDTEGFAQGYLATCVVGYKQLCHRLRAKGLGYKEARAEAERRAMARLAVEAERVQGHSERVPA